MLPLDSRDLAFPLVAVLRREGCGKVVLDEAPELLPAGVCMVKEYGLKSVSGA